MVLLDTEPTTLLDPNPATVEQLVQEAIDRWVNRPHSLARCECCGGRAAGAAIEPRELRVLELELQEIVGEEAPRVRVMESPPGSRRVTIWQEGDNR